MINEGTHKQQEMKLFLSFSDVVNRWGFPVRTIYRLVELGKIPYTKIGGRVLFRQELLEEFLNKNTIGVKHEDRETE